MRDKIDTLVSCKKIKVQNLKAILDKAKEVSIKVNTVLSHFSLMLSLIDHFFIKAYYLNISSAKLVLGAIFLSSIGLLVSNGLSPNRSSKSLFPLWCSDGLYVT